MANERTDEPRGILDPKTLSKYVTLNRYLPNAGLSPYIEHYWQVRWKLPVDTSYTSETLPHPSVHMVVEPGIAYVQGVTTRHFSYTSRGTATVFSVKFLPGMFFPFAGEPVSHFTDRRIPLDELYGPEGSAFAAAVRRAPDEDARIRATESFLEAMLDRWISSRARRAAERIQTTCCRVRDMVQHVEETRECTSVARLAEAFGGPSNRTGIRSLQGLFSRYVGVGPKWVIRRYRLHEAIAVLDTEREIDLASLAVELGYSDQAHFTNDFRAMTGRTPGRYTHSATEEAGASGPCASSSSTNAPR